MADFNYYAVMEETSPRDRHITMVGENSQNGELHSLKFRACMQSFEKRNRNGRMWHTNFMKQALASPHLKELIMNGDMAGENGHPVPMTGQASIERISTIDPNNISHRILSFDWEGDLVYSIVETIDDGNGPGNKFARSILQHMEPAFSVRAIVPQRKNPDGSIEVTGPGRVITYDRVILPSHPEAYRDKNSDVHQATYTNSFANEAVCVEVKNLIPAENYNQVMESFVYSYIANNSDRVKYATENTGIALETASYNPEGGVFNVATLDKNITHVSVPVEESIKVRANKYMNEFYKRF